MLADIPATIVPSTQILTKKGNEAFQSTDKFIVMVIVIVIYLFVNNLINCTLSFMVLHYNDRTY